MKRNDSPCQNRLMELLRALRPLIPKCRGGGMAFRRLRLGRTPAIVASLYAVLGLCASANQNYEVFPFFSWFLFPFTPQHQVERYELTPRPPLTKLGMLHLTDLDQLVQRLGKAAAAGDQEQTLKVRRLIEENFLVSPCTYSVSKVLYDPVARWDGASAISLSSLEFECLQAR